MRPGFIVALAWPETNCKKAGAWYDRLMHIAGISKQNYYKVGHAAVILIDSFNGKCYYFDFGRYHAPAGKGRVRDVWSDHDLHINTKAIITEAGIENLKDILTELQANISCHGEGQLYASSTHCQFDRVYSTAKSMQDKIFIPYGPFVWNGTNCSRFVHSLLLNSHLNSLIKLKVRMPWILSPSPLGIVKGLGQILIVPKQLPIQINESDLGYEYQIY